jgi:hypothetical protein
MGETPPLDFSLPELHRVLPLGWRLEDESGGTWNAARGAWVATLRDGSGLDWEVSVEPDAVHALGRFEALRQAVQAAMRRR